MKLQNFMEHEVFLVIDKLLKENTDICNCKKCRMDIAAISLNNLKPKYVVTEKGELYTKTAEMEPQFEVDIIREVTKAIEIVRKQPRHDIK